MAGEPERTPEASNGAFAIQSFVEVEAHARQVLREKGCSEELIEAQLARVNRDYPDWPALEGQVAGKTEDRE